jgi:ribosomal protein S18 acetylase RimI-like enzyme
VTRAHADVLCLTVDGKVEGCAIVAYRTGLTSARLYSLAVAPRLQGLGYGARLLEAAERAARRRGCLSLRLEVRMRNRAARGMYERRAYRTIAKLDPYYEDGAPALRLERIFSAPVKTRSQQPQRRFRSAASPPHMR